MRVTIFSLFFLATVGCQTTQQPEATSQIKGAWKGSPQKIVTTYQQNRYEFGLKKPDGVKTSMLFCATPSCEKVLLEAVSEGTFNLDPRQDKNGWNIHIRDQSSFLTAPHVDGIRLLEKFLPNPNQPLHVGKKYESFVVPKEHGCKKRTTSNDHCFVFHPKEDRITLKSLIYQTEIFRALPSCAKK